MVPPSVLYYEVTTVPWKENIWVIYLVPSHPLSYWWDWMEGLHMSDETPFLSLSCLDGSSACARHPQASFIFARGIAERNMTRNISRKPDVCQVHILSQT